MLDDVKIVKGVLPEAVNTSIIQYLANNCQWTIGRENRFTPYQMLLEKKFLAGFSVESQNNSTHDFLNTCALIITEKIKEQFKISQGATRFFWNMYYPNHKSLGHIDDPKDDSVSIVYNLNTTNGGTMIDNKFYQDKAGEAKVFRSNLQHQGIGDTSNTCRFNLNVLLER